MGSAEEHKKRSYDVTAKRFVVKCIKCGTFIYSRTRHDFHWCPCKSVAVDGGGEYAKISGEPDDFVCVGDLDTGHTESTLYKDWNLMLDLLGFNYHTEPRGLEQWQEAAWKIIAKRNNIGVKRGRKKK